MSARGKLNSENVNNAMPVDAPLYPNPPFYYKDAKAISIQYETDQDAVLNLLPDALEIDGTATATVMFIEYPFSTLGPYEETILGINCTFKGEPRFYIPHIVLNGDAPFAGGREIYGYPKKLATIEISEEGDALVGKMERPAGHLICSAGFRPEVPVEIPDEAKGVQVDTWSMALRVIPSHEKAGRPSIAELVEINSKMTVKEVWSGTGWASFHSNSTLDPWHKLEIGRIVSATSQTYDMILGFGRTVQEY